MTGRERRVDALLREDRLVHVLGPRLRGLGDVEVPADGHRLDPQLQQVDLVLQLGLLRVERHRRLAGDDRVGGLRVDRGELADQAVALHDVLAELRLDLDRYVGGQGGRAGERCADDGECDSVA